MDFLQNLNDSRLQQITTPVEITPAIIDFCKSIDPSQEPVFLDVPALNESNRFRVGECHFNAHAFTDGAGGSVAYGWIIWERLDMYLDAEFHSVWVNPVSDELRDVTPQGDEESHILFMRDSAGSYDLELQPYVKNRRKALREDSQIQDYLELMDKFHELGRTAWGGMRSAIEQDDVARLRAVRRAMERCKNEIRTIIAGDSPAEEV